MNNYPRVGALYVIRNTVNNYMYIGKTYKPIDIRFREHKYLANSKGTTKLCCAMREIGIDNFYIEKIGEYVKGELEQKEREYIQKYGTIEFGYNTNRGGDNSPALDDATYIEIMKDLESNMSLADISAKYSISVTFLRQLLKVYGIEHITNNKPDRSIKKIVGLNITDNKVYEFDSISDAYKFMLQSYSSKLKKGHFYYQVKYSIETGRIAFGIFWFRVDYIEKLDEIHVMKYKTFGIKKYLDVTYKGKKFYTLQTNNFKQLHKNIEINTPNNVGHTAFVSSSVTEADVHTINYLAVTGSYQDIDTLRQLYPKFSAYAISKAFGVSYNTIDKWLKRFGLK